ncbi:carboxylate-amine ligase [Legionella spiritensis]|uniref:Glutamate--cysteine ligase, GCS2 n=1 Tax=Legionella spiritensis TaxID=452 RepID=A0A0W0Z081_LEGSP|nr:glutamate-cysteine ligase family protein [Legionella spiritensis]KTD62549.1 Glutamate--cysteine ligase, GCS2 [Legionella spiritensis]SNV30697.1 Glutamate--cysteine ligase, GCS2 [Legionella spiritensis]
MFRLFSVIGLEIEYMLVDKDTLEVQPKSDLILQALADGELTNEVALGDIAVSNELVLHVLELKNNGPKPPDSEIVNQFQSTIMQLQPLLNHHNLILLPTGAHPWMNPATETRRWPHGNREIYQQYDALFNCEGHGWANLQSMHINLPFADDTEFCRLHNAIRLILPLLPAIGASTPFLDGAFSGMQDARLYFYDKNQQRIPAITGDVIPEFITSAQQYQSDILLPMYDAIRPFDPKGILQFEWLNSRAAIPKFEYGAIEIRILDSQECVMADYAIARSIVAILKNWIESSSFFIDNPCDNKPLVDVYRQSIYQGLHTPIGDKVLSQQWQLSRQVKNCRDVWYQLIERVSHDLDSNSQRVMETILSQGNLSERLLRACGQDHSLPTLKRLYRQLGHCLLANQLFTAL